MKNIDEIKFEEKKRHQAGMTVPEGFFEQFQQQLEAKIDTLEAVKPAPVVEMPRRQTVGWMRWAVAACCLLLVGIGGVYLMDNADSASATQSLAEESVDNAEGSNSASEMEEMLIRSVNDFELYDFYCEL